MPLPRPSRPSILIQDLRAFFAERSKHHVIAAVLAVIMPVVIIVGFIVDANTNTAPGPQLIYVESWRADRSDEEIIADQKRDQAAREKLKAERRREFDKIDKSLEKLGI